MNSVNSGEFLNQETIHSLNFSIELSSRKQFISIHYEVYPFEGLEMKFFELNWNMSCSGRSFSTKRIQLEYN